MVVSHRTDGIWTVGQESKVKRMRELRLFGAGPAAVVVIPFRHPSFLGFAT
jgi:hypothetical protein